MDKVEIVEDCNGLAAVLCNAWEVVDLILTGYTGQELAGKALDLAVGERDKVVALKEVEDTRAQEIHDNADMATIVEAIT